MRVLKKIAIGIGVTLAILMAGSFILRHQFEDVLKKKLVEAINDQLQTKLYISEDIEFSIFQKFPYASLKLHQVRADEVNSLDKDTLFQFENLYFQFNIIDLLNKKYDIQKIHADGGFLKLNRNDEGVTNFDIFRKKKDTANTALNLALNDVRLSNVRLIYKDDISQQDIDFLGKEIKLKGLFASDSFDMSIDTDLDVTHYISESITYYTGKPAKISLQIAINSTMGTYRITDGKVELAELSMETSGIIKSTANGDEIDIKVSGQNVDLQKALSLLPPNLQKELGDYKTTGKTTLDITLKGEVGNGKLPQVIAGFSVASGSLKSKAHKVDIRRINLNGTYTNGVRKSAETSELVFNNFSAELDEGNIAGSFSYKNFKRPNVVLKANAKAKIEELAGLFNIEWIERPSGLAQVKVDYSGRLGKAGTFGADDIKNGKISGEVFLFDGAFKMKDSQKKIEELNGKFKFNKEDLVIEQFTGEYAGSDFKLDGSLKNILPYFLDEKEKLTVQAKLISNKVDLDQLLASNGTPSESKGEYKLQLSDRVNFDLGLDVDQLTFRRFKANDISGKFWIQNKKLIADKLVFKAMQGSFNGTLQLDASRQDKYPVSCIASIKGIDVHDLFYECENFTQDFIVEKHLKGKADVDLTLKSELSETLAMDFTKLDVDGDLMIKNGELIEFEPLQELAKFVRLDELERVQFSELANHISIKNETVIIPKMEIKSSAIDLAIAGEHSFHNDIEYHFRLLLSDVLGKKAKERKQENTEYAVDENAGKMYLYLVMKGTVDDYRIAYDTKAVKDKIKEDFRQEKKDLKIALNQEFGWFKKDSAVTNYKEPEKKPAQLTVTWDEDDTDKETDEGESTEKKPKFRPLKAPKQESNEAKKEGGSFNLEWDY